MKTNEVKKWEFITYTRKKENAIKIANEIITKDLKNPNLKIEKIKKLKPFGYKIIVKEKK